MISTQKSARVSDEEKLAERYRLAESLIAEQNFSGGVVAAVIAMFAGALGWGVATVVVGAVPAWFAIALGALVGYGMQLFGRGLTTKYSVVAAVLAVIGCLAGTLVAAIIYRSNRSIEQIREIVSTLRFEDLLDFYASTLEIIDVLFWFLAAAAAWYFAQRDLSQEEDFAMRAWAERPDPSQGMIS